MFGKVCGAGGAKHSRGVCIAVFGLGGKWGRAAVQKLRIATVRKPAKFHCKRNLRSAAKPGPAQWPKHGAVRRASGRPQVAPAPPIIINPSDLGLSTVDTICRHTFIIMRRFFGKDVVRRAFMWGGVRNCMACLDGPGVGVGPGPQQPLNLWHICTCFLPAQ